MNIVIHENREDHLVEFVALNERWIEEYFHIEESDRNLAADPSAIWRNGGSIFTATVDEVVVGCCALFKMGKGVFELARMAVHPDFQKRGIGRKLALRAIGKLEAEGADRVELLSNTILEPAIALYRSLGFETIFEGQHTTYSRCNIVMARTISSSCGSDSSSDGSS